MSLSPPPSPPTTHEFHFPVLAIALIGITATGILLVTYYIYVIKCCLTFSRRRNLDTDATSATISTPSPPGLDDAVIRSIPVVNFRKSSANRKKYDGDVKSDECSNELELECAVCLCAFEEGEKLRVIPNCCHAFHIDCIDIWLQNSANCPLCRSSVSATTMLYNNPDIAKKYCNAGSSRSSSGRGYNDNFSGDDDDYLVIEIQGNNLDGPRLITRKNSRNDELLEGEIKGMNKKFGRVSSMGDELIDSLRKQDEEFQVQAIRRSISMDLSSKRDFCVEIQEHCTSSNDNMLVSEVNSSNSNSSCNNKVKRSMFSFGYGRSSRGSIQPIELDP